MEKEKILIVDDEEHIGKQMKWALSHEYETFLARNTNETIRILNKEHPSLITLDLGLPPNPRDAATGLKLLEQITEFDRTIKVIVITGNEEKQNALEAIGIGAYDYYYKPVDVDEIRLILRRALHIQKLERENRKLHGMLEREERFGEIIGTEPKMQAIFSSMRKVATTDVAVLITGESGTGKEMTAREIHRNSHRSEKPLSVINCGAIPENLLESELFGHEKGAFTGAHVRIKGKFELAHGGTLFLDEVGELNLSLQVKLLRFLQEHVIERIGGREMIHVDVRIITATNKDLKKAIKDGTFRDDLYHRLAVVTLHLPPLRDRKKDILILHKIFLGRYAEQYKKHFKGVTKSTLSSILKYEWPGNIRELQNRIKRAVIMSDNERITAADLELDHIISRDIGDNALIENRKTLQHAREEAEKEIIQKMLIGNNYNITKTAGDLGISRPTLHKLINRYNIDTKT